MAGRDLGRQKRNVEAFLLTTMSDMPLEKKYRLIGAEGKSLLSDTPGTFGGHRRTKVYGRLDCPAALRALAKGGYKAHRVFFAVEATAIAAGFRPCAACLPDANRQWSAQQNS